MFSVSGYSAIERTPGHLTVTAPGSSLFGAWFLVLCFLVFPPIFLAVARSARRSNDRLTAQYPQRTLPDISSRIRLTYLIGGLLTIGAPCLLWAIGYTSGSIDLDKPANRVTMTGRMTAFLPAQSHATDLTSISRATLDYKPNSRRIRLVANSGPDLAFPIWSDRPGQQEAVNAINNFLQAQGGEP